MVGIVVDARVGDVPGAAFEPVLADDNRTPFAFLYVLGHEQNTESKDIGVNVQHDFVAEVLWLVENETAARIGGHAGIGKLANNFLPEVAPILACALVPRLDARFVDFRPEGRSAEFAFPHQILGMREQLVILALEARFRIG